MSRRDDVRYGFRVLRESSPAYVQGLIDALEQGYLAERDFNSSEEITTIGADVRELLDALQRDGVGLAARIRRGP